MRLCLVKLGLKVNDIQSVTPTLTSLHLSSSEPGEITRLLARLKAVITLEDGKEIIRDAHDRFRLKRSVDSSLESKEAPSTASNPGEFPSTSELARALQSTSESKELSLSTAESEASPQMPTFDGGNSTAGEMERNLDIDYKSLTKSVIYYEESFPDLKIVPLFNHESYFRYLKHYYTQKEDADPSFGRTLLYGNVVTSTNTLLEK